MGKLAKKWKQAAKCHPGVREDDGTSLSEGLSTVVEGPTLQDILQSITSTREALETKIDTLGAKFGILQDDHRRLAERITNVEWTLPEIPPELSNIKERLTTV
ncbi:hypothetical protein NDU88_007116 [Pleurodeles waltl]|uniref:Uncharacterized protein n=1 Tax=Pleurodeles waltl TaxID=8319 RepID=A0AAV7QQM2_PLEWA|nr:hypothetical protein NDU88_007116 [Pleurodeles waltl]